MGYRCLKTRKFIDKIVKSKKFFIIFFILIVFPCNPLGNRVFNNQILFSDYLQTSNDEENDSWTKTWNLLGLDFILSIDFDSMDNIFMLGYTRDPETDQFCNYLTKLNKSGDIIWQKLLDNNNFSIVGGHLKIDGYDNLYLSGVHESYTNRDRFVLFKYDSTGNYIWNKTWALFQNFYINDMDIDQFGNIYVVGSNILLKINSTGSMIWNRTLSGEYSVFYSVSSVNENQVYITGELIGFDFPIYKKGILLVYNSSGFNNWNYTWETDSNQNDMAIDSEGCIIIADGTLIMKCNSTGNPLWNCTLAEPSNSLELVVTNHIDEIFIMSNRLIPCYDNSFFSVSECVCTAIYLSKISSSGNLLWEQRCTGCDDTSCYDIGTDKIGNVYLAGVLSAEFGCSKFLCDALLMKNPKPFVGNCIEIYYDLIIPTIAVLVLITVGVIILINYILHKRKISKIT